MLAAVLRLPADERAELAERVFDSTDPPQWDIDGMADDEFAAELERRHAGPPSRCHASDRRPWPSGGAKEPAIRHRRRSASTGSRPASAWPR